MTLRRKTLRALYRSRRMSLMTSRVSSAVLVALPEARNRSMKVCWIAKRFSASLTWLLLSPNCWLSFDMAAPRRELRRKNAVPRSLVPYPSKQAWTTHCLSLFQSEVKIGRCLVLPAEPGHLADCSSDPRQDLSRCLVACFRLRHPPQSSLPCRRWDKISVPLGFLAGLCANVPSVEGPDHRPLLCATSGEPRLPEMRLRSLRSCGRRGPPRFHVALIERGFKPHPMPGEDPS
jgi:hypothetical protein